MKHMINESQNPGTDFRRCATKRKNRLNGIATGLMTRKGRGWNHASTSRVRGRTILS